MKEKTINNIIKNKFNHFLKSITDESVKTLVEKGTIITGGCITSMLLNDDVNDYDMYFHNKETAWAVLNYYVNQFIKDNATHNNIHVRDVDNKIEVYVVSGGIVSSDDTEKVEEPVGFLKSEKRDEKTGKYIPLVLTSNAVTLSDQIQLITRFFGTPDEIHSNFDFIHCTNYWCSWEKEVKFNKEALLSTMSKELKYRGSLYPVCSMFRIRKFLERGWTINAGESLRIAFQISKLDLEDINVLRNQLVGVDSTYFNNLIMRLRESKKEITETYLGQLIDEIF